MAFSERVKELPILGLGVSTEYGAGAQANALDVRTLRQQYPQYANFLEIGIETSKGWDPDAQAWIDAGWPTTYHFLDVNLDDPEDLDSVWLEQVKNVAQTLRPAWLCGDAGLWHFGRRDRGHMLLLPPILSNDSASAMAQGIGYLRDAVGYEVLPENPPGAAFIGNLHLLDFFTRVCERADTGMLLDCAHLAIFQRMRGHEPTTGLDGFPLERVVELHIAGGVVRESNGFSYVDDSHTTAVLPEVWSILDYVLPRCPNLKAVVFECERNTLQECLGGFELISKALEGSALNP